MTLLPTPSTLAGGALIGAAAVLLYLSVGRIAGISGITYGLAWSPDRGWRAAFLLGLFAGGALAAHLLSFGLPPTTSDPLWLLLLAGALVGFGTQFGNGCTSGHGICGLSRLSPRSLASVLVFMGMGMATATLLRPVLS